MSTIVTRELKLLSARSFVSSVSDEASGPYYTWIGNHVDPSATRPVFDDVFYTSVDPYRNMIAGKAVGAADVTLLIRSIPYAANVVYAMYDDQDPELFGKDYYVTVESGSFTHVFKCLYNNQANASTTAPDFGDVNPGDEVYVTADGYQWKYMFTVDDVSILKFSTSGFIPVIANSSVENAARAGSIDVITVDDPGLGYNNYLNGTFSGGEISVGGNSSVFSVASNSMAAAANGFYTGCVLYLSSGTGAGQHRTVSDYQSNALGRYVVLDSAFVVSPTNGTQWQMTPKVNVLGTGDQTVSASARALINSVGNTIQKVEMLETGLGYTMTSAVVLANSVVSVVSPAVVRVISSFPGGHGSDSASELGCTRAAVSVQLANSEGNTIPTSGRFGQFGLMTRPTFSSANLGFSSFGQTPDLNQTVNVLSKTRVRLSANVAQGSNTVTASAQFQDVISIGDLIYVNDGVDRMASHAVSVNSSSVTLNSAIGFTSSNATIYKAAVEATATISIINAANSFVVRNISGNVAVGSEVIVLDGGAWGVINSMTRSGVSKDLSTFVAMQKVVGSYVSGAFVENEVVYQGNSLPTASLTARLHSIKDNGGVVSVFMTGVTGILSTSSPLVGNTSGAILSFANKYEAEIVSGSGRVIYIENIEPVERSPTQRETFVYVLEF